MLKTEPVSNLGSAEKQAIDYLRARLSHTVISMSSAILDAAEPALGSPHTAPDYDPTAIVLALMSLAAEFEPHCACDHEAVVCDHHFFRAFECETNAMYDHSRSKDRESILSFEKLDVVLLEGPQVALQPSCKFLEINLVTHLRRHGSRAFFEQLVRWETAPENSLLLRRRALSNPMHHPLQ